VVPSGGPAGNGWLLPGGPVYGSRVPSGRAGLNFPGSAGGTSGTGGSDWRPLNFQFGPDPGFINSRGRFQRLGHSGSDQFTGFHSFRWPAGLAPRILAFRARLNLSHSKGANSWGGKVVPGQHSGELAFNGFQGWATAGRCWDPAREPRVFGVRPRVVTKASPRQEGPRDRGLTRIEYRWGP